MSGAQTAAIPQRPAVPSLLRDFLTLTKPKVQSLLLFTTVTTMYVAGDPSLGLVLLTCLGGALSAGGAGAINHAIDRDIDRTMARTADRPVASGRISAKTAIGFGALLELCSFTLLATTVNPLAAALSFSGFFGYVFVYTLWLKRTTPPRTSSSAVPPVPCLPWSPGRPLPAASAAPPSTSSRSSSFGPRPTSGRSHC
jgi:protoheme IX farnesyltransferase